MPEPVLGLLDRARSTSSTLDRHWHLYLALEASIRLGVAARRGRIDKPFDEARFDHPAVGAWGEVLARSLEPTRTAKASSDVHWDFIKEQEVVEAVDFLDGPRQRTRTVRSASKLLDAVASHRNRTFGHGGSRDDAFHEASASALEVVLHRGWESGLFWPRGWQLERSPIGPDHPLLEAPVVTVTPARFELAPLVVHHGGRWLFYNARTDKKAMYLDYLGDRDETHVDHTAFGTSGEALVHELRKLLGETRGDLPQLEGRDRYAVIEPLGAGGMGLVMLARDLVTQELVALKYPDVTRTDDRQEMKHRLEREAELLAGLTEKKLRKVALYRDHFDDGGPVFVMEYVDGCRLDEFAARLDEGLAPEVAFDEARRRQEARPSTMVHPPWSKAAVATYLGLVAGAAETLADVHDAEVVHNDVKPSNILVHQVQSGLETVLIDFGIARRGQTHTNLTGIQGTSGFAAPESELGRWSPRSDVYSFGRLLQTELLECDHRVKALSPVIREKLRRLSERCCQRLPELRPASAREVADELRRLHASASARGPSLLRTGLSLFEIVVFLLAVVGAVTLIARRPSPASSPSVGSSRATASAEVPSAPSMDTLRLPPSPSASAAAGTPEPERLSDNCRRWLEAARHQRYDGTFGVELERVARGIARRQLRYTDLSLQPEALPCHDESKEAWELYVLAAMVSVDAWSRNQNLEVSARLHQELAAKHRDPHEAWPADRAIRNVIDRHARVLVRMAAGDAPKHEADAQRAVRACRFALAVGSDEPLCTTFLKDRGE